MDSEPLPDSLTRKQNNPVKEAMFTTVSSFIGYDNKYLKGVENGKPKYFRTN